MLKSALENWAAWNLPEKPALVRVFTNGQNHQTGLIACGATQFVLKVFKHSFSRTIEAERWASNHAFSPRLKFAANNIAVYEFIDDRGFSIDKIANLGATLRRIHDSDALTNIDTASTVNQNFDLLSFCGTYLTTASSDIHEWHRLLMPAISQFTNDQTRPVFCHNDLVRQNCLFHDDSVKFIDWEFAQLNNPWFDLAAIVHYFELSSAHALAFLSSYRSDWAAKPKTQFSIPLKLRCCGAIYSGIYTVTAIATV